MRALSSPSPLRALAIAATVFLGACAAPIDPLWHEELDARVTKWDIVNDELRVIALVEAPDQREPGSTLGLTFRVDELRVAEAAVDVSNGKLIHEPRAGGTTALEFRARLLQSGLATEPVLTVSAQCGMTFRGTPRSAIFPAKVGQQVLWEHPEVPGLQLALESWDQKAVAVSVATPPGGSLELHVQAGGKRVKTEALRVAQLIRLAFVEPCPPGAEIVATWRSERRCLARIEAEDLPQTAQ